ncbi:MAG: hypothetical protein EP346_10785 [Bacteroidetes bacterium]|nr:MAG: hypothetical protein EP346_10785 [Bacteroidota bacterium]
MDSPPNATIVYLSVVKKSLENLLVLLLLLPLIWIYTPATQDWGGDFAAYIHQAQNILQGEEIGDIGYLYNPDYYRLAPPSYPPGFSILLAGWIAVFGSEIGGLVLLMSLLMVVFGLGFYRVLRLQFKPVVSMVALLLTFYNPWMIRFKIEVIADMPFALLVVWSTLAYFKAATAKEKQFRKWLICAILVALTILTKTLGWVVLIAFVLDGVVRFIRSKCAESLLGVGILSGVTFGLVYITQHFWLPAPADHLEHFTSIAANSPSTWDTLVANVPLYFDIYKAFFIKDLGSWGWIGTTTSSILLLFALIGAVVSWIKKGMHVTDWVFLGLMGGLVLFPITNGFRYLLPAYVFFFSYSIYGLGLLPWHWLIRGWLPFLSLMFLGGQYVNGWTKIADLPHQSEGPYLLEYAELHQRIDDISKRYPDALFAAAKPRVFAFMHDIEAFSVRPDLGVKATEKQFYELAAGRRVYVIHVKATPHASLDSLSRNTPLPDDSQPRAYVVGPWREPIQSTPDSSDISLHYDFPYSYMLTYFQLPSRWQYSESPLFRYFTSGLTHSYFAIEKRDTTYHWQYNSNLPESDISEGTLTEELWTQLDSILRAYDFYQRPIYHGYLFSSLDGGPTTIEAASGGQYNLISRRRRSIDRFPGTHEDSLFLSLDTAVLHFINESIVKLEP